MLNQARTEYGEGADHYGPCPDISITPTGRHMYHFDWWLTEATMRSLHSCIDAVTKLLITTLDLHPTPTTAKQLATAVTESGAHVDLAQALRDFNESDAFHRLGAFVNHVKHTGFPERQVEEYELYDANNSPIRQTSVAEFRYRNYSYGPWMPNEIDDIIDDVREHLLRIVATVTEWVEEPPPQTSIQISPSELF